MEFNHVSVLLEECINGLKIKPNGIYVDGTLGGAGHSIKICEKLSEEGVLIGIDQDEVAIGVSSKRLAKYNNVHIVRDNYSSYLNILQNLNVKKVDGILLDLGVSSYQLDEKDRGFSYMKDAPLDMRMDQRQEITAKDIVNSYSEKKLIQIFRDYGEERFAVRIAKNILKYRELNKINTTYQLVDIIKKSIPVRMQKDGHPAKRVFQAIRIELNQELNVLKDTLHHMINSLNDEGRLCVITFHSLEDRIVKHIFKEEEDPCICPKDFPICVCGKKSSGKVITKKPIIPSDKEKMDNPRSKSAKLRIFERKEVEKCEGKV